MKCWYQTQNTEKDDVLFCICILTNIWMSWWQSQFLDDSYFIEILLSDGFSIISTASSMKINNLHSKLDSCLTVGALTHSTADSSVQLQKISIMGGKIVKNFGKFTEEFWHLQGNILSWSENYLLRKIIFQYWFIFCCVLFNFDMYNIIKVRGCLSSGHLASWAPPHSIVFFL